MTANQTQIVPLSSVSRSLQQKDSKGVIRALASITPVKLIDDRATYDDCRQRIADLEHSLAFFANEWTGEKDEQEKYIATIEEHMTEATTALQQIQCSPYLFELARQDYDELVDSIEFLLLDTIEYFDVPKETIVQRSSELAVELVEKYKSLTIDDVALCLRMARDGDFGELYHRLDGMTIKMWFKAYWETVSMMKYEIQESQHSRTKDARSSGYLQAAQAKIAAIMQRCRSIRYEQPESIKDAPIETEK